MILESKNLYIKRLELKDVHGFKKWGKHTNILLSDYDFKETNDIGVLSWYMAKTYSIFSKYFCILDKDKNEIGYLGMKNINILFKSSVLGLVIDPKLVGKNFGTEALSLFLDYYFNELKMKKMILEVASYNTRAIRLYEKIGFKMCGEFLYEYPNDPPNPSNEEFLKHMDKFVMYRGKLYATAYRMELDSREYLG